MNRERSFASRIIKAPRARLYQAFLTPEDLAAWLPPGGMRGVVHAFDASVGGGYDMSLFYPQTERRFRGKTAEREDRVRVRFVELVPDARIVEAVTFVADDPALAGEMTLTVAFHERGGATEVSLSFENLPPGVRAQDNDEGARLSLENLARRVETAG